MSQKISAQRPPQCDNHKRHDHHGHDRVCRQHCEINRPRYSLPRKTRGAVMQMVNDVGNQKHDRRGQGGKLTTSVRQDAAAANEVETQTEQDETRSVERGIEVRENRVEIGKQKAVGSRQSAERARRNDGCINWYQLLDAGYGCCLLLTAYCRLFYSFPSASGQRQPATRGHGGLSSKE